MDFQPLPREALQEQMANLALMILLLVLPLYVGLIFVLFSMFSQSETFFLKALFWGAILALASAAYGRYFCVLRHRRCQWRLDNHSLCFHIGLWQRHEYYIARSRVQYVDVRQGPLERRFGVSQLFIHTASSMNVVVLRGLLYEDAQAVRHELIGEHTPSAGGFAS